MSDRGRGLAARIVECHWEIELERAFDRRDECERIADDAGLERIDSGTKRTAFAVDGDLVDGDAECSLKVAYTPLGYYENRSEIFWWAEMPEAAREYFAPVLDHEPGWRETDHAARWVLMPRAERDLTQDELDEVWYNLGDVGFVGEDVEDAHQLGRIDGAPVIVDYGRGAFVEPVE